MGSGCAQPHLGTPDTHLPPAWPSWHSPRQRGWGPPGPYSAPGYFGPLCPRCPAGRWHCPQHRCPMTAGEILPTATMAGWAAVPRGGAAEGLCPPLCPPTPCPHSGSYRGRGHSGPGCIPAVRRGDEAGVCPPPRAPAAAVAGLPRPWRRCPSPACSARTSEGERVGRGVMEGLVPRLLRPRGETEAGEKQAHCHGLPAPQGARQADRWPWHPKGKGWRCLWRCQAVHQGMPRCVWINGDRPAHAPSAGSWHHQYQSPALPRCSSRHWGGGGWGRASCDGSTARPAGSIFEGWYWGCAGALQVPPLGTTKSRAGLFPRRQPRPPTRDMSWLVSASSREAGGHWRAGHTHSPQGRGGHSIGRGAASVL